MIASATVEAHYRARIASRPAYPALLELSAEDGRVLCSVLYAVGSPENLKRAIQRLWHEATIRGYRITDPTTTQTLTDMSVSVLAVSAGFGRAPTPLQPVPAQVLGAGC